jgi:hypothetical protein
MTVNIKKGFLSKLLGAWGMKRLNSCLWFFCFNAPLLGALDIDSKFRFWPREYRILPDGFVLMLNNIKIHQVVLKSSQAYYFPCRIVLKSCWTVLFASPVILTPLLHSKNPRGNFPLSLLVLWQSRNIYYRPNSAIAFGN